MTACSAGILLYKYVGRELQVLLVHPGGPFWKNKDEGAWSIPKGLHEGDENPLTTAKREFAEETGYEIDGKFIDLGEIRQPSRKVVHAWAIEHDLDAANISSNTFSLEWPKNSGNLQTYPEIDRAEWFNIDQARRRILKGQAAFLDRLLAAIDSV